MKKNVINPERSKDYFLSLKTIRIMKLSVILLTLTLAQVFAAKSYSQRTKISLELKDVMVKDVLAKIESQSDFYFLYSPKMIDDTKKVDISVKGVKINKILDELFAGTNTDYVIFGKQIVISNKSQISPFAQDSKKITVKGKVIDERGDPIPGVNIVEKGTTNGTITDNNGEYQLTVTGKESAIDFSFIGYNTQEVIVGDKTVINITLIESYISLDEVVSVGYGTQKKVNLTGSVDVISAKEMESRPVASVEQALQGAAPNLNITLSRNGGEPGATMNWNIRGLGTLTGSNAPLILVDGVAMDVNSIDPETIESVSVLKDAAASAIYGSRAPFGVVLITTKKGKKGEGFTLSYTNNIGFANAINLPQFPSSLEVAEAFNQAAANTGASPVFDDAHIQRIKDYLDGKITEEYDYANPYDNLENGRWEGNANYNWIEEFFKKNSLRQKHNINLSGGSKSTSYYISAGYYDQNGQYNWGDDYFKRYNLMANVNSKITDWFTLNFSTKYSKNKTDYPIGPWGKDRRNVYFELMHYFPSQPWHAEDGHLIHPIAANMENAGRERNDANDLMMTLGASFEPVKGWVTNVSYNYNYYGSVHTWFSKEVLVQTPAGNYQNLGPSLTRFKKDMETSGYQVLNATTSYHKDINSHYFNILLGYEQEINDYTGLYGDKGNLLSSEVPSISTATGDVNIDDWAGHWATQGVFGRLNYNYKEKYLFEFNARYNGSSRFAQDNRWGFFPSASIGYNIAKEGYWSGLVDFINNFKLRASYGSLGNQNVPNYLYLSTMDIRSQLEWIMGSSRPLYVNHAPNLISPTLTWETITTMNLGVDLGFFRNRFNVTFDYYKRKTSDMFGPAESLPEVLGTSAPQENNAEMMTKGWEMSVLWKDRINNFSYNIGFMLGDSKSEILKYRNPDKWLGNWYEGQQVGEIWGYETDGFIQSDSETIPDQTYIWGGNWGPGDYKYKDLNDDGKIDEGGYTLEDHGDLKVIGNSLPRYNYSISAGFSWKGIDFNMFWQGVGRREFYKDMWSSWNSVVFYGITSEQSQASVFKQHLDYWRPADDNVLGPNTDAYYAKPYFSDETFKNYQTQTKYLLNAAYIRLKNVQLGYTLPLDLTKKASIKKIRLYFSGENLITITKLTKLFDPETGPASRGSGYIYPLSSVFSFGVNLTF